jgi:two-component system chemotaxis sensor kinase CheA
MSSIEKILRVRSGDIQTVSGRNVLRFRDKVISLISLRESLMIPNAAGEGNFRKFVIVAGLADKFYGFGVDRLVGQQELVIKVLDNHWGSVNYTAGASILGDGSVVLILDAPSLVAAEIGRELSRV